MSTSLPRAKRADREEMIRIRLKSYDHTQIDRATKEIIETARRAGALVHGAVPLPTHIEKLTVLTSPHGHKDARDQYEIRVHKRLILISLSGGGGAVDALMRLGLSSGVSVDVKVCNEKE